MANFKQLRVWHTGMQVVSTLHGVIDTFPRTGASELKSQMKRAAISIPSNIAEGANRGHDGDFRRFLGIALGSCGELETQLEIARGLGLVDEQSCSALLNVLNIEARMLRKLISSLG